MPASITDTVLAPPFATYTRFPSGEATTPTGFAASPIEMVAVTSCVRVSTTLTEPPISAVTQARLPLGANAAARGRTSTRNDATTLSLRTSMTDTVLLVSAVT